MKMKRKIIALCVVVAMLTVAIVGGTFAYFTDTDAQVNVMTMGNVKIEQLEQKRGADGEMEVLNPNTGYHIVPAVYDTIAWADPDADGNALIFSDDIANVYDKFVSVKNVGKSDAYIRTIIAFEDSGKVVDKLHVNVSEIDLFKLAADGVVIDGVPYEVYTFTYPEALAAGEVTDYSLKQFLFDKFTLNEDVEACGDLYSILVLSQAVQASGFEDAEKALDAGFGDVNVANIQKWFGGDEFTVPVFVSGNTELDSAISNGETSILLGSGAYIIPDSAQGKTLTINGNGDTRIATQDDGSYEGCDYSLDGATVTFNDIVINTDSRTYTGYARMSGTYNNCTINGTYTLYGKSVFNNCTFNVSGDIYNIWTWGAGEAEFNNCTFNCDGKAMLVYNSNCNLKFVDCVFNDNGDDTITGKSAIETGVDGPNTSYNIEITNIKVNGFAENDKCVGYKNIVGNKNSMSTDKLNVVIDGVDVY